MQPRGRARGGRNMARARGGGGGGFLSVIIFIVVAALIIAFCRINGIYDYQSLSRYLHHASNNVSNTVRSIDYDKISNMCNFLKDESCLSRNDVQQEIGDLNGDGKIDRADTELFKQQARKDGKLNDGGQQAAPGNQTQQELLAGIASIKTQPRQDVKYKRTEWKHWVMIEGNCDAREESLKRVGFKTDPSTCKALPGFEYHEPYTGKTVTNPRKLDIDHLIPLGYVASEGGQSWSPQQKQTYANDVDTVLIPADASSNRQKGDKGPGEWMPSDKGYHCEYAKRWITIANKYGIGATDKDKQALTAAIKTCG